MVPLFMNVRERSTVKNYHPNLLSGVNNGFENIVNDKIVDDLEKCDIFSDFQFQSF